MQQLSCIVVENHTVAESCHRLVFRCPPGHQAPQAGQFLTLRLGQGISPLLRRPFAYAGYDAEGGTVEIVYERRGTATAQLAALEPGDSLDMIGPLGNCFPLPEAGKRPVLIAGGIGIGPILMLHRRLQAAGLNPLMLAGSRTAARLPLGLLPDSCLVCTDDGSRDFKGNVVQRLDAGIGVDRASMVLYACGPHGMMRAVAAWAAEGPGRPAVDAWVSLEQTMACAVGACMGCVVQIHHEKQYSRVCAEGPVYPATRIVWHG